MKWVEDIEKSMYRDLGKGMVYSPNYDKDKRDLIAAVEIMENALVAVKKFWDDIDTPKAYFIGDTCAEALETVRKLR